MTDFVGAFRADTGEPVTIPAGWLGHPVLGEPFTKTKPSGKTAPATKTDSKEKK